MPKPSFEAVKAEALRQIETLCAKLVPSGRREGVWWRARVPWRNGDGRNLAISLTSGIWRDWARPGDEGTMLDLVMKLDGCDLLTARNTLAGLLGISDVPCDWKPKERPKLKCGDCRYVWKRSPSTWACTATLDPLTEEPEQTFWARRAGWPCGPTGRLFETPLPDIEPAPAQTRAEP